MDAPPLYASEFNHAVTVGPNIALYNARSGACVLVGKTYYQQVVQPLLRLGDGDSDLVAQFTAQGFLVPGDVDERQVFKQTYLEQRNSNGLLLTIAVTVACNLRCGYCFQDHPARTFGKEDVESVLRFVEAELPAGEPLSVTWFGGEPLLAWARLVELYAGLAEICRTKGSAFGQSVITNGLLLDKKKAYSLARMDISYLQVTLDGPKEQHDQRRVRINGAGTFDAILDNVVEAVKVSLPVTIRVNVDSSNHRFLGQLLDALDERGLSGKVGVSLGYVDEYTDQVVLSESQKRLTREEFAGIEVRFLFEAIKRGYARSPVPKPSYGPICTVDSPGGYVFSPGGARFQCWNEAAEPVGSAPQLLTPKGLVDQKEDVWQNYDPFSHTECDTCSVQPLCKGGCPWEAAKRKEEGPGYCSTLRWNLADRIRLNFVQPDMTNDSLGNTIRLLSSGNQS